MKEKRLLRGILSRNEGQRVWRVQQGYGSFLTVDVGKRVTVNGRKGQKIERGSMQVWVQYCRWSIRENGAVLLDSDAGGEPAEVFSKVVGASLRGFGLAREGCVEVTFSRELSLVMTADAAEYDEGDDLFTVFEDGRLPVSYSVRRGVYEGE